MLALLETKMTIGFGKRWLDIQIWLVDFNRLDSTILKAGEGKVIAKEG